MIATVRSGQAGRQCPRGARAVGGREAGAHVDDDRLDSPDEDDDSGVLEPGDSLVDRGVGDVLDEGWSAPERPYAVEDWGTTGDEESAGESLAGRLRREVPEGSDDDGDGLGDTSDTDGELRDDEVGDVRAGRLSELDDRGTEELVADDEGIDGGAASAEEAAVHVVED